MGPGSVSPYYVDHLFLLHMERCEVHRKGEFMFSSGFDGTVFSSLLVEKLFFRVQGYMVRVSGHQF